MQVKKGNKKDKRSMELKIKKRINEKLLFLQKTMKWKISGKNAKMKVKNP